MLGYLLMAWPLLTTGLFKIDLWFTRFDSSMVPTKLLIHDILMGAIVPALMHRIPSELSS